MTVCTIWQGAYDASGYGRYGQIRAHRWKWIAARGSIPDGMVVHHKCENRACVRLSHLQLVTRAEHARLHSEAMHRWSTSRAATITHCPHGHPYDRENTRWRARANGRSTRDCKACDRIRHRRSSRDHSQA